MIGSQAILGQFPDAPAALLVSHEADIYAPARPDLSASAGGSGSQGGLRARRWPGRSSPPSTTAFFFVELSSRCAAASAPRRSTRRG